jgi:uncharacterized protein
MAVSIGNKSCILYFVKSPERTPVKSRLAAVLGAGCARELYGNFVLDMLDTLDAVTTEGSHDLKVYFTPPGAGREIRKWLGGTYNYSPQRGDDLGERMHNAFLSCFALGYDRAILLGSDTPDLSSAIISESLDCLLTHPAVIGPSCDGGYYLLGFQAQAFLPAVFYGMPWSTGQVYTLASDVFRRAKVNVHILPTWRDIDTFADLKDLQKDCRKNRFDGSRTMRYLQTLKPIVSCTI